MLKIGEVARQGGVSPDTVRHYERIGLLPKPARSASGYRQFPPETIARVQLIQRALGVGFSLAELGELLRTKDKGGVPCQQAYSLLAGKLARVEEQLAALKLFRDELQTTLTHWEQVLAAQPPGAPARLLETLEAVPNPQRGKRL